MPSDEAKFAHSMVVSRTSKWHGKFPAVEAASPLAVAVFLEDCKLADKLAIREGLLAFLAVSTTRQTDCWKRAAERLMIEHELSPDLFGDAVMPTSASAGTVLSDDVDLHLARDCSNC
jgi:hypothetical protein